ncbi:MAG: shikimate kinase [Clostridia bacterium]|nr:shikimate kinase [Clostridia bacterium]
MNLVLCGMMGAGKTTVGKALAKQSKRKCLDTDAVITKKHGDIKNIFASCGEAHFRGLETATVRDLTKKDKMVVSVGGGLVLRKENVDLLKENGKIVYLRAKKETLVRRLQSDKSRPLLQGEDLEKRVENLIQERAETYERVADYIIDVDGKTPETIAKEILVLTESK